MYTLNEENHQKDTMHGFLNWSEAFEVGVEHVGGKGWNLARLQRYGFEVPRGGVLTAQVYRNFIIQNQLIDIINKLSTLITINNIHEKEIEEELTRFREKIILSPMSPNIEHLLVCKLDEMNLSGKPVAVRSSASAEDSTAASFAGIHESFLNICGMERILMAIKECYASLWTTKAVSYRRKMKIEDMEVIPAVVIMEMVEAKASGISFTCDPRTGREDRITVNANFGLGESTVEGLIEPDEYIIDTKEILPKLIHTSLGSKKMMTVLEEVGTKIIETKELATKQVLHEHEIHQLALLVMRVYHALGAGEQHQDIEWVFTGKRFILVQARPVTELPQYVIPELRELPNIWSNSNLRDAMPMVQSTLNWSLLKNTTNSILNIGFDAINYSLPPGLKYVRLFQGRIYVNTTLQQYYAYKVFAISDQEIKTSYGGHQSGVEFQKNHHNHGLFGWRKLWYTIKMIAALQKAYKQAGKVFTTLQSFTQKELKKDFRQCPNQNFIDTILDNHKIYREYFPIYMLITLGADSTNKMLYQKLNKIFPEKGMAIANSLQTGAAQITSAKQGYDLVKLAEVASEDPHSHSFFSNENFNALQWKEKLPEHSIFKQKFKDYLAEFGHRGVYELDIINPRWREDPTYLLHVIKNNIDTVNTSQILKQQQRKNKRVRQEINRLPIYKRLSIQYWLAEAKKSSEQREAAKYYFLMPSELSRNIFVEIGRRLTEKGILMDKADIFHCHWLEIYSILHEDWNGKGLQLLVNERKERRREWESLSPPDVIIEDKPQYIEQVNHGLENVLSGIGVAAGIASGIVRIISHPAEGDKLKAGDILVAPSTDPGWTPLFLRAAAIVMETGGYLSHSAIVAREYGIPAVVNIPGVLKILEDGQEIVVDGDQGKVFL